MIDQLRSAIHFGESFPAFASVVAGPEGSIWVQHVKVASELSEDEYESFNPIEDTGAADWDIFDSDGRFLGVLTMPSRFTPRVIRDDLIRQIRFAVGQCSSFIEDQRAACVGRFQ